MVKPAEHPVAVSSGFGLSARGEAKLLTASNKDIIKETWLINFVHMVRLLSKFQVKVSIDYLVLFSSQFSLQAEVFSEDGEILEIDIVGAVEVGAVGLAGVRYGEPLLGEDTDIELIDEVVTV